MTPLDPPAFTLELLHIADQEASSPAVVDAPNLSAVLNALRDEDLGEDGMPDNTLTLSSGDAFIPGVFYDASDAVFGAAGIADIQIQNELGIQAIAFGNHEFDFGTEELGRLIAGVTYVLADLDGDGDADDKVTDADGNFVFSTTPLGDFGALTTSELAGQPFTGADFPYLSANLDVTADANLANLAGPSGTAPAPNTITSSVVIDVNGEEIGVVGATTPRLGSISSPGDVGVFPSPFGANPTEAEIDALAAAIQTEVDALLLANDAMNKVVLLSHMQQLDIELALAERLSGVDIIVGGGSNRRLFDENDRQRDGDSDQGDYPQFVMNADGGMTAVVNTDGSYKYVGRLVIGFDTDGNILPGTYDPDVSGAYATDAQGVGDLGAQGLIDPEIAAIAEAIEAQIIATESNVFGVSDVFLNGNRSGTDDPTDPDGVRTQETNLGNLTADANLVAAQVADPEVVLSLKNGGGIRASIGETVVPPGGTEAVRAPNPEIFDGDGNLVKPAGGISQTDIQTALAFNNGLTLLTLTKTEIVALLEHGVSAIPGVSGRFAQVSGVEISYDPDQPAGARIQNAAIFDADGSFVTALVKDGQIVGDPFAEFRIVTLDFLAAPRFDDDGNFTGGGDGYPFPNLADPAVAARVNPVRLEQEDVATGDATFADDGTEQDALAEYLDAFFNPAKGGIAYGEAEQGRDNDGRIQNLDFRADAVFGAEVAEIRDRMKGTEGSDRFDSGAGAQDRMFSQLDEAVDFFVFDGSVTNNGQRDRDFVFDFEIGLDVLLLTGGAEVAGVFEDRGDLLVRFAGDGDLLRLEGPDLTEEGLMIETIVAPDMIA